MCGFAIDSPKWDFITARTGSKGWRGEPTECTRWARERVKDETRARFPWASSVLAEPTMTENTVECAVAGRENERANFATRRFARPRRAKGADRPRGLHIRPRFRSFPIQHGAGRSSGRTRSLCTEASLQWRNLPFNEEAPFNPIASGPAGKAAHSGVRQRWFDGARSEDPENGESPISGLSICSMRFVCPLASNNRSEGAGAHCSWWSIGGSNP